jgi:hypothetical protein
MSLQPEPKKDVINISENERRYLMQKARCLADANADGGGNDSSWSSLYDALERNNLEMLNRVNAYCTNNEVKGIIHNILNPPKQPELPDDKPFGYYSNDFDY